MYYNFDSPNQILRAMAGEMAQGSTPILTSAHYNINELSQSVETHKWIKGYHNIIDSLLSD